MNLFEKVLLKIDEYFSANENKIINDLTCELSNKNDIILYNDKSIQTFINTLKERDNKITELTINNNELLNNISFNKIFKESKTKYTWKPGQKIYLHLTLQNFSSDVEYQEKYLAFLKELGLKDDYENIDDAVYNIVLMVQKYVNNTLSDDYKSDEEVHSTSEYWLSIREAFDQYVTGITAGDCEDTSNLLYGSIVSGLKYLGYNYTNKLLRVDIDFPAGHAIVAYQKINGVWSCIESTYGESRFSKNWVRDKDMFKGVYTGLWHIFDEETEYELIHPYERK